MGSFILQFYQDTTNNCILKKILKDCFIFNTAKNSNMNYYFRSQNKSNTGGMIAIRKPKKSVKWADYNLEKPLQQIRLIDIVGKGKNYLIEILIILLQIIYKITNLKL